MDTHYKDNKFPKRRIDGKKCTWYRTKSHEKRSKEQKKNKIKQDAIKNSVLCSQNICVYHHITNCPCNEEIIEAYYDELSAIAYYECMYDDCRYYDYY